MTKNPIILGLDTSGPYCAAALHCGSRSIAFSQEDMTKGQAERLIPLAEELLAEEGFGWLDLDALAVGVGPGNFTGIRIAVSAVRGLALGLGIPVIPVSNFEVMRGPNSVSDKDPQLVSLAAPREANYLQLFVGGAAVGAARHVTVSSERLTLPDLADDTTVLGHNTLDIGVLVRHVDSETSPLTKDAEITQVPQTLIRVAAAKWQAGHVDGSRPAPLYIKPPDAAPARDTAPWISE